MTSKDILQQALAHRQPDKICVDFGSTMITGFHVRVVEQLRKHYGLENHPVKVVDPFQMLGEVEPDLQEIIGVDIVPLAGENCFFGFPFRDWKEFKTPWGQICLVPGGFTTDIRDTNGDYLMFPQGDTSVPASARMPYDGYFYDAIIRQQGQIDDSKLNSEDNLEEFEPISDSAVKFFKQECERLNQTGKGIIASFGGTGLGDIALVPGAQLKHPKGIRDVAEWYMSTVIRKDYLHEVFDKQTDIALENIKKIYAAIGDSIDVLNVCGTDFGTQDSQFCSGEDFDELYKPYYQKINNWVHKNTKWKTFKHSCGAMIPLMENIIDAGFDCINPVQINAKDMDPAFLKREFGDRIVFWGGGVNTQTTMIKGTPGQVKDEVKMLCDIFGRDGGFVFNAVHNVQANVPIENVIAMIDAIREINHIK